ncbi:hypothetical protein BCR34DRAFT_616857 [Clohesyomyces aquaticus]|uniref:Uncharacterized protein n=1 Tax=Clohesyomyces aquaticus TaxID=1231657 RepID=A0A1Y1ZAC5_9PLEO|nr:hypothetical protein BCR34DRAFT_616857 [Clohesyomyces aquaticus]
MAASSEQYQVQIISTRFIKCNVLAAFCSAREDEFGHEWEYEISRGGILKLTALRPLTERELDEISRQSHGPIESMFSDNNEPALDIDDLNAKRFQVESSKRTESDDATAESDRSTKNHQSGKLITSTGLLNPTDFSPDALPPHLVKFDISHMSHQANQIDPRLYLLQVPQPPRPRSALDNANSADPILRFYSEQDVGSRASSPPYSFAAVETPELDLFDEEAMRDALTDQTFGSALPRSPPEFVPPYISDGVLDPPADKITGSRAYVSARCELCGASYEGPQAREWRKDHVCFIERVNVTSALGELSGMKRTDSVPAHAGAVDFKRPPSDSGYASKSDGVTSGHYIEAERAKRPESSPNANERLPTVEDDLESIGSDPFDIQSEASAETAPLASQGKLHLAWVLANDKTLGPLCQKLSSGMGKERFIRTIRRLLKTFYVNLVQEPKTNRELSSVHLLKSRRGRARIGTAIWNALEGEDGEPTEERGEKSQDTILRAELLEAWLAQTPHNEPTESSPEENPRTLEDHLDTVSESLGSGTESEDEEFPHLAAVEAFFKDSTPFQVLCNDIRNLILSQRLKRILSSITDGQLWISRSQNESISNAIKTLVEDYSCLTWIWWPLEPRMRKLEDGEARLFWECGCGTRIWSEISLGEAELIDALIPTLGTGSPSPHRCLIRKEKISIRHRLKGIINAAASFSRAGQRYTPPNNASSSFRTENYPQARGSSQPTNTSSHRPQQQGGTTPGQTPPHSTPPPRIPPPVALWIVFGVQQPRRNVRIDHIPVSRGTSDRNFYRALRECYKRGRGWLRLWFSMWRLHYCDIVKFKRVAPKWVIKERKDLPTSLEYEYTPRPPSADNPPIPQHEFEMHLSACVQPCRWSLLHECMPELSTSSVLDSIPKKATRFDVHSRSATDVYAWGLEAKFAVSALYVAIYHLLIFAFPFGFWVWWMKGHPNDLQGASVPATIALGLLSLFWSTNGILTEGRHP